jgi:glutathione S-transferase
VSELILHHFPVSPYSEKVRLILGFKKLAWKSVLVPMMPPKPDVLALTGGYRRTPFLQIGSDIYCDSALIAEVLENREPAPALFPTDQAGLARILAQWADSLLFWATIRFNRGLLSVGKPLGGLSPEAAKALAADRKAMGFDLEWVSPSDAAVPFHNYLARLKEILAAKPFLLGPAPSIADFAAFHSLWYLCGRAGAAMDSDRLDPQIKDWMTRMTAFGHGNCADIEAEHAVVTAAQSQPMAIGHNHLKSSGFVDTHGVSLGSKVAISAESFGLEPTHGELIAATSSHYSLRRNDQRAGVVHVHFPRIGYVLKT